jgi:hypothetical protein
MAFMQPQITSKARWLKGEAKDGGTYFAPDDVFSKKEFAREVLGYTDGEWSGVAVEVETVVGWGVRRSAPGFMDCTDWEVFTSHDEALERFAELRAEDADPEGEE